MSLEDRAREPTNGRRQTTRAGEGQGIGLTEGDLQCPICMSLLADPFVTACGHSFCHTCLSKHLAQRKTCPTCFTFLTLDKCFPNFALQQVIAKAEVVELGRKQNPADALRTWLGTDQAKLSMEELDGLLALLTERKGQAEQHAVAVNGKLLLSFLQHCMKRKSRRLRELQNEIGWLDADLEAARAVPSDTFLPGLLDQHDLLPPHSTTSTPPLSNGFRPHAHPAAVAPMHEDRSAGGSAILQHEAAHASCNGHSFPHAAGRASPHQPNATAPFLQQQQQPPGVQASPFAAAHARSPTHAEGGERSRSGSPRGIPGSMALIPGLSLATELSLPEGLPLSAYPVPAGPSSLASMPSQSPPPDVGGSGHGLSRAEAARAASPAGAWAASLADSPKSADARAASPAGSVRSADARAASPARPSRMSSQPCNPGDALMGPPPRVHPLPGHRMQSGLGHRGQRAADRSANGVVPRADAPTRSRDSAGLTLPPPEDMAASVRSKKRRVTAHLGDLQNAYIRMREQASSASHAPHDAHGDQQHLHSSDAPAVSDPATHEACHQLQLPHTHASDLAASLPASQQDPTNLPPAGLSGHDVHDPHLGSASGRSHSEPASHHHHHHHHMHTSTGVGPAVMGNHALRELVARQHGNHDATQQRHHVLHATAGRLGNDDLASMAPSHHAAAADARPASHGSHAQPLHHEDLGHGEAHHQQHGLRLAGAHSRDHHQAASSRQHSHSHHHAAASHEQHHQSPGFDEQEAHGHSHGHSHSHTSSHSHSHGHHQTAGMAEQHSHMHELPTGTEQHRHRHHGSHGIGSHSHHIHHHHHHDSGDPGAAVLGPVLENPGLAEFSRVLATFTRSNKLEVMAQLLRPASRQQSAAILSSIEFDAESKVFATAGVSKQISFYDFPSIMAEPAAESQDPVMELTSRWKLSCIAWNQMSSNSLLSADYEGCVCLWDVGRGQGQSVVEFDAHERRIWSAAFCPMKATQFVSGSDDGWVKVWSSQQQKSLAEIDVRANVCTVQWNPITSHELAVGSANHDVHLYDLRRPTEPTFVFKAHQKAVSYVRYLNSTELVSASTDSTLRLLDTRRQTAVRKYSGHANEKNFVGLSSSGDFMACGSETNEVYVYNKNLEHQVAKKCFSHPAPPGPNDFPPFISSVCWKPHASLLLAANSEGTIKIFKLTS